VIELESHHPIQKARERKINRKRKRESGHGPSSAHTCNTLLNPILLSNCSTLSELLTHPKTITNARQMKIEGGSGNVSIVLPTSSPQYSPRLFSSLANAETEQPCLSTEFEF